jgi:hypothetical protein
MLRLSHVLRIESVECLLWATMHLERGVPFYKYVYRKGGCWLMVLNSRRFGEEAQPCENSIARHCSGFHRFTAVHPAICSFS